MPIVVGKLTPQQVAPFGQLLNMYADAAEARDRYNATSADQGQAVTIRLRPAFLAW